MSPLMILQKMHESSVAIEAIVLATIGVEVKLRRGVRLFRILVLGAVSRKKRVYEGLNELWW